VGRRVRTNRRSRGQIGDRIGTWRLERSYVGSPTGGCVDGRLQLDLERSRIAFSICTAPLAGLALVTILACFGLLAVSASASASPIWNVESEARPTAFQPTDSPEVDNYRIEIENLGGASSGSITVVDHLPTGVSAASTPVEENNFPHSKWSCSEGAGQTVVTCTSNVPVAPVRDAFNKLEPAETPSAVTPIVIPVTVAGGTPPETGTNIVTVSGGGAVSLASSNSTNPIDSGPDTSFGTSFLHFRSVGPDGEQSTQAGGHPWALTTDFEFNQEPERPNETYQEAIRGGDFKNVPTGDEAKTVVAEVPLGLLGNPQATPRCTQRQFTEGAGNNLNACPADTRVGVIYLELPGLAGPYQLFNLVSASGHAAEFGFSYTGIGIILYGDLVHSDRGGYVVRIISSNPQTFLRGASLTFFGDPAAAFETGAAEAPPFLIDPVDCAAAEAARTMQVHVDTWTAPGIGDPFNADFADPNWVTASVTVPPVDGCEALKFNPSLSFKPAPAFEGGTSQADEPSGYEVNLEVPQTETLSELETPELKTVTVTLPRGLSVSPSAANGLQACSDAEIALESDELASCPLASQIGTVQITTPLLERPLDGVVFLGEPECSPCSAADAEAGRLFRVFIQTHSDEVGQTVKLSGTLKVNPVTGQLTAQFAENPQVPFSDLELDLNDGPRASLANPQGCGTFTPSSVLEPWSAPLTANVTSESPFAISWDGQGGGCPASVPFAPSFSAGTGSPAAGAYSPLTVEFSRQDREQDLSGITVHTPAGMLGNLSGVPLCGEPQASQGSCGEASLIGSTSAVVGPGADPFAITDGRAYLTGPYKGAPFGLSIVVPAVAGPFNLGSVVVRASIAINPSTAALTVTSDPLPQIVGGVPIRLRKVVVDVNRPEFILNATGCVSRKVEATLTGLEGFTATHGSSVSVSSPYSASGCANLAFKPKFAVSTLGKTSKADGASLTATVSYPNAAQGTQADVAAVKVDLPKQLPSRLTTLQKACTAAQFETNPAGCPAASFIGHAVVHTPILPGVGGGLLTGPAIFVSHGGEAFPSLTLVLQGDNVTIDLIGSTFISKAGITSTTFKTVPDAPFSMFELTLPQGPYSALTATGNLCTSKLAVPTAFIAQNGAVIHESTKITATGCRATKALTRAQKLAAALKACHKKKGSKRAACEQQAHKTDGPEHRAKNEKPSHGKGRK
jgi:hypothetical protein